MQHTFKFKPTIDNPRIFVNTHTHTHTHIYIYIYKRDLRIVAHLLHVYLPITNGLSNYQDLVLFTCNFTASFNDTVSKTRTKYRVNMFFQHQKGVHLHLVNLALKNSLVFVR